MQHGCALIVGKRLGVRKSALVLSSVRHAARVASTSATRFEFRPSELFGNGKRCGCKCSQNVIAHLIKSRSIKRACATSWRDEWSNSPQDPRVQSVMERYAKSRNGWPGGSLLMRSRWVPSDNVGRTQL